MLYFRLFCLVFYTSVFSGAAGPSQADTFSAAGVVSGEVMAEAECRWPDTSVWVVVDGRGACIRYFHAGLARANLVVHVWLHGDRLSRSWDAAGATLENRVISYRRPAPGALQAQAARAYRSFGIPYIRLSRPGVYGSSGDHKQRRRLREVRVVNAALTALREKYRIARFALSGQSGGGHLVASLLTYRDDVACAVITSGVTAVKRRIAARGWPTDSTGYRDFFDPIDHVGRIRSDPARRIFIVGDPRDTNVPFENQSAYHRALVAAGHSAHLVRASATGSRHHGLSPIGFRVMQACLEGQGAPEIAARAAGGFPQSASAAAEPTGSFSHRNK